MDINGDGFIDLPVEYREDYAQEASEKIFFLQYMSCAGTETKPQINQDAVKIKIHQLRLQFKTN